MKMIFRNFTHSKISISLSICDFLIIENAIDNFIEEKNKNIPNGFFSKLNNFDLEEVVKAKSQLSLYLNTDAVYKKAVQEEKDKDIFRDDDFSILTLEEERQKNEYKHNTYLLFSSDIKNIFTILTIADFYIEENERLEFLNTENDWFPPESFQYGTDDEREIYKMHYKK